MMMLRQIVVVMSCAFYASTVAAQNTASLVTNHVPFTRIADSSALSIESISGEYEDDNPDTGGLGGRNLYLFPDASFVLTEWLDIMPETARITGTWNLVQCSVNLTHANTLVGFDSTYTAVIYDDEQKCRMLLVGSPAGQTRFQRFLNEHSNAVEKARTDYVSMTDRSTNFVFRSWAEEVTYVMMFSAGYAMRKPITREEMDQTKTNLLWRCATHPGWQ